MCEGDKYGRLGGNQKRPYEIEKPRVIEEIAFPTIPQDNLIDTPIILEAMIEGFMVRRIYLDRGSSLEIVYEHCFWSFSAHTRSKLRKSSAPFVGFSGEIYHPIGLVDLQVTIGEPGRSKTVLLEFDNVKCHSPYNFIIGRTWMRSLEAEGSTIHLMINFPTVNGVATLKTSREILRESIHIEETQNSWKETQWRQHMEQMSRIKERAALQN
ncbi:hypothetical protein Tco_1547168 [Tanacetum coccineum]